MKGLDIGSLFSEVIYCVILHFVLFSINLSDLFTFRFLEVSAYIFLNRSALSLLVASILLLDKCKILFF